MRFVFKGLAAVELLLLSSMTLAVEYRWPPVTNAAASSERDDAGAVAERKTEHLGWTMGTWPGGLHNSPLTAQVLELDQPAWTFGSPASLYAVVGAWIDNWKTFVEPRGKELVLGGDRFFDHATVLWRFQAPPGNRFAGGTIIASLSRQGAGGDESCYLAVGTSLTLIGGGSFFQGFQGYNSAEFKKAAVRDSGRTQLKLEIPTGVDTFYVAVSRDTLPEGRAAKLTLHGLEVRPRLANPYGLTLRFDRVEPVWSQGEPIRLRTVATGNPPPKRAWWRLVRRDGSVHRTGSAFDIDLSGAEAGYFALHVFDQPDTKKPLDTQDLVILYPQDTAVTAETSLFGVMGSEFDLARRIGVKWAVAGYQWAWRQPGPKDPVQPPDASTIRQYREYGIEPIVHIDTAPGWANGGKSATAAPEEKFYPQWLAFNQTAAAALRDCATWFQSWNEPNNNSAFEFNPWDPAKVAAKAKEVQRVQYRGIKKGNPDARLIGGCFAGAPADWFAMWLTGDDSTLGFQNAMSGHPYCEAFEKEGYQHKRPPEPTLIPELLAVRKAMDTHGAKDQPLFWTEFGWDTTCTSDDDQARWIARHLIIQQAYREQLRTKAVCLFSFGYNTSYCPFYPPQTVRSGGHRFRPAVGAYATVAGILAGSTLKARILDYPTPVYLYAFIKGPETIYVAWATETAKTHAVTLPLAHRQPAVNVSLLGQRTAVVLDPNTPINLPENHDPAFWIVNGKFPQD